MDWIVIILIVIILIVLLSIFCNSTNEHMTAAAESNQSPVATSLARVTSPPASLQPAVQNFVNNLAKANASPIYTLQPIAARNVLIDLQKSYKVNLIPASIQDIDLPIEPKVSVRLVRPVNSASEVLPIIMYFHGGGWVLGNTSTHDRLIREIANGVHAAVIFVNYTLAPDAQYPTQIMQAYGAMKYIIHNASKFRLDANNVAVFGDSVGGNMATVITLMAKAENEAMDKIKIKFQVLFYPVTNANFNTASYNQFANGPWLSKKEMMWFWNNYLPDVSKRKEIYASPLQATLNDLSGLPPALVVTDENDVLRDEGEAYGNKLAKAGVDVIQTRYLGTMHDFIMLNALADTAPTVGAIDQAIRCLRDAFYNNKQIE